MIERNSCSVKQSLSPRKRFRKTLVGAAIVASFGTSVVAQADVVQFSFTGLFTMLSSTGAPLQNTSNPFYADPTWGYGLRTQIAGTMTFDTVAGTGTGTIVPFDFFNGGPAAAQSISFQAIGNGAGGPGTLVLGNMLFNWNGNNGIPVSIVMDAAGMFSVSSYTLNQTISGVGAIPASNGMKKGAFPIGPSPIATTTWDTTLVGALCTGTNGASCMGRNPSGGLPLIADAAAPTGYTPAQVGIGGDPMIAGPFVGFNANFDVTSMTVTSINGISAAASISSTSPANNATAVPIAGTVTITFTQPMNAATVAAAFTLTGPGGAAVPGTVSPNTGSTATTFVFTPTNPLSYSTVYTATVGATARDAAGSALAAGATNPWSFTTGSAPVSQGPGGLTCAFPAVAGSFTGTFTMLDPAGSRVGRDTGVSGTWDGTVNLTSNGTNFNMTLQSPNPFFGAIWTTHDIRVFGPGTYTINTGCSTAELRAGTAPSSCAVIGETMTFTVGPGQLGAHMLFDWNGNNNISVVNVWNRNSASSCVASAVPLRPNDGPAIGYGLAMTDVNTDGIAGLPMATTSPFPRFNANFDLYATAAVPQPPAALPDAGSAGGGCTVSRNGAPEPLLSAMALIAMGWLAYRRRVH